MVETNQLIGFDQVFQSINCNQLIAMHLIANAIFHIPGRDPERESNPRPNKAETLPLMLTFDGP